MFFLLFIYIHNFFSFIPRVGLNFGDVTAGVIGTTKLYYDIWGDGKYIPIYATLLFKIHMYKKYLRIFLQLLILPPEWNLLECKAEFKSPKGVCMF